MFHSPLCHEYPHRQPFVDLAALAEAKAAEAAVKAAQAEYLALQARARVLQQQQLEASYYPYPYAAPDHFGYPRLGGLAGYPSNYRGSFESALSERDILEAKLKEERLARLRAERELQLKEQEFRERERRLSQARPVYTAPPTKPRFQAEAAVPTFDLTSFITSLAQPAPAPAQKPRAAPEKPRCASKSAAKSSQWHPSVEEFLLSSLFGVPIRPTTKAAEPAKQTPKESTKPAPKPTETEKPASSSPSSSGKSLLDQLKARYEKEGDTEVKDTIQAILNSLSECNNYINAAAIRALSDNPSCASTSAKAEKPEDDVVGHLWATINALSSPLPSTKSTAPATSSTEATAESSEAPPDVKGKGKETATSTPISAESAPRDVKAALDRVERITATFKHLSADFAFPSKLDFTIDTTGVSVSSKPSLAFTARNHPVHNYEHTLTSLLSQLDLIESHGDPTLRSRRKDAARAIEEALEELEREIVGRWKASLASLAKAAAQMTTTEKEEAPKHSEEDSVKLTEETMKEEEQVSSMASPVPNPVVAEDVAQSEVSTAAVKEDDKVEELLAQESTATPESTIESPSANISVESPATTESTAEEAESPASPTIAAQPESDQQTTNSFTVPIIEEPVSPSLKSDASLEAEEQESTSSLGAATESAEDSSSATAEDDAFLLARSPSLAAGSSSVKGAKRRSVEIEDLGSDWEDLDS